METMTGNGLSTNQPMCCKEVASGGLYTAVTQLGSSILACSSMLIGYHS
jgi:hypothetical protein